MTNIDVAHEINATQRKVGHRTLDAGEARTVVVSRSYAAVLDDVWDACTNAERIPRWFLPVSGELCLGGRYQLEGNAGGTIESCDPPRGFTATWEFGGEITWIELRLTIEADGRTRFELTHIARVDDERWLQFGPGAVGVGWELGLLGLSLHLEGGPARDPQEVVAWTISEEGKQFITQSSQGWRDASIGAGTDAAEARAAADRTTAFYTGMNSESPAAT